MNFNNEDFGTTSTHTSKNNIKDNTVENNAEIWQRLHGEALQGEETEGHGYAE